MADKFRGIPYAGISPSAHLAEWRDDAIRVWERFEQTLPPGQRGWLARSVDPWRDGSARQRSGAVGALAETMQDLARIDLDTEGLSVTDWRDALLAQSRSMQIAAGLVQYGSADAILHPYTARRLTAVVAELHDRIVALAERLQASEITEAQAQAWAATSGQGLIRAAGQIGSAGRMDGVPVRRILQGGEDHCATCPEKARAYESLAECIASCGGWPGDGSDQCHGNCYCQLEPATEFSVYGDLTDGLLDPLGPRGL